MKAFLLAYFTIIIIQNTVCSNIDIHKDSHFPVLKGPYLGQKPPDLEPELFAPGIISTKDNEALFGIFKHGTYIIFDRKPNGFKDWAKNPVYITQEIIENWEPPALTENLGRPWYLDYPHPNNGQEVYYTWWLPLDKNGRISDINIWKVKFTEDRWGEPHKLRYRINTNHFDAWPSIAKNGVLYFHSNREDSFGRSDIYKSVLVDGKYSTVENLGTKINTPGLEHDPCIALDGSFLIYSSDREGSQGKDDLYVTFQTENGEWSDPINLGASVNSEASENRPYLTPDEKYLFFTSTRNANLDIFWVDVKIIEELISHHAANRFHPSEK